MNLAFWSTPANGGAISLPTSARERYLTTLC